MITIKKKSGKQTETELDAKMQKLLFELGENPDPEKEKEVISLYEKMTDYDSSCGICRNGREMFKKGIKEIMSGNAQGGIQFIKASRAALTVNLHRLARKFGFKNA